MNYSFVASRPTRPPPMPIAPAFTAADIAVHDDVLAPDEREALHRFLMAPGWAYGAYSDPTPGAPRYWCKHFAGYVRDGREARDEAAFEAELDAAAAPVGWMWRRLKSTVLEGHALSRCYANAYPTGSEGGLHQDSDVPHHYTAIYYPHAEWRPNYAGETMFFDHKGEDVLAAVYPKPNRLVVFPGLIPHVARCTSRTCPELRVTLMFKTAKAG
jgi:SM-20-related protein